MLISQNGIELIQHFEQCRLSAYRDNGGVLTIGWGHTAGVVLGHTLTQQEADALFVEDLRTVSAGVTAALGHVRAKQANFDAFCSFAFNEGVGAFTGSTLLKRYLSGQECRDEFLRWVYVDGVLKTNLVIRRMAERLLFLNRGWIGII